MQATLDDIDGAVEYIISAENKHPNRLDIVGSPSSAAPPNKNVFARGQDSISISIQQPKSGTFGAPSQPAALAAFGVPGSRATNGAFGQPSQPGGQNAFGAPSQPSNGGAFGQGTGSGQNTNPFGTPSGLSQSGAVSQPPQRGGFGAPSQPSSSNAFGAPSQTVTSNPFGAPSQPVKNAFGGVASIPFGAPSPARPNPFAAPSQPAAPNMFGAPSQPAAPGTFGAPSRTATSNPFATQSQPAKNVFGGVSSTPFGAPSPARPNPFASGQPPLSPSPLGAQSGGTASSNPFGATSQPPPTNPFGQASSASASATIAATNPFANPQMKAPGATGVFGGPSNGQASTNGNAFGSPQTAPTIPGSDMSISAIEEELSRHPPLSSYATHVNGRLTVWKGRRVEYRKEIPGYIADDHGWIRIWYPNGPPPPNLDVQMADDTYDNATRLAYLHKRRTGRYPAGVAIPFLPPKQAWIQYDM
jgi:nucleoporin NUP42